MSIYEGMTKEQLLAAYRSVVREILNLREEEIGNAELRAEVAALKAELSARK